MTLQITGENLLHRQHWYVWKQKYLFTVLPDAGIQVFDIDSHTLISPLIKVEGATCIIGFEDKNILLVGSKDGKIYQIGIPSLLVTLVKEFKMPSGCLESFCFVEAKGVYIPLLYDAQSGMSYVLGSNSKVMLQAKGQSIISTSNGVILMASNHPQKGSKVQKWNIEKDPKAQSIKTFTHDSVIQQVKYHSGSGSIYIGDHKGRLVIKQDSEDGNDIIRHWHALPLGDFVVLEGGGILSGGQESVLVRWSNISGFENDYDESGSHQKQKLKEGKEFISRIGGAITGLQLSNSGIDHDISTSVYISTSDNDLIQVDLMEFGITGRFSLFNNNSPLLISNSAYTVCPGNAPGSLMIFDLNRAKVLDSYFPEPLMFRFTPNEPNEPIDFPTVYSLSSNDRFLASLEVDLGQQILRIHSALVGEQSLAFEQECVIYSPHNNANKLACGWFGEDQLVTFDSSHLLRVWRSGTCVLEENQGKWRCTSEFENVSHFACNQSFLVFITNECELFVNLQKKWDLPDLGTICKLFVMNQSLLIQTDKQHLLVVDLLRDEFAITKGFHNIVIEAVAVQDSKRNAILYKYSDGTKYLVENIDFTVEEPFKARTACSANLNWIGIDGKGQLVKQFKSHLEFVNSGLVSAASSLETSGSHPLKRKKLWYTDDVGQAPIKSAPEMVFNLAGALKSLQYIPSHSLPSVTDIYTLLFK
jgi:hypothetical protein